MTPVLLSLPRLERTTLSDQVHRHLADLLMSGRLAPGERLSLRAVAEKLGVSMMPVREAVTRLAAEGAVEVSPKRAVAVPVMSLDQFRELTIIRAEIEGFAAERAALVRRGDDLARIAAMEAAFRLEAEKPRPDAGLAVAANKEFHFALYEAAGLPSLVEIIAGLWLKAGPVLNLDMRASPERLKTGGAKRLHAMALAAVRACDGPGARAAIAADIEGAYAFIASKGVLPS